MSSSRETSAGGLHSSHSVFSQHSVLVSRVAKENRVALPCSSWLRALGSTDDSARGALPCGQTAGAQVGLVRRKLPALWGEAGPWNVDHL